MIPRNDNNVQTKSWQKQLSETITDPAQLLQYVGIEPDHYKAHFAAEQLFPVKAPEAYVQRIQYGNIDDPLLKQVMASALEFVQTPEYTTDPLQEHQTVLPGLLHKYHNRVLFIATGQCAINCRYCFRRHFPYQDNQPNKKDWQQAFDYINAHSEIDEVILSGGDPLILKDSYLAYFVQQLEAIPHVKRLRIHSRLPVVIPARITSALLDIAKTSRLQWIMVLHINHPNEIDNMVEHACREMTQANIMLLNQSVLLKGVNDSTETLCQLSQTLFQNRIIPYYLHLLDKVAGAQHFDLSASTAHTLYQAMQSQLSGYLVPKLVREIAGEPNKTQVINILNI